MYMGAQGLVRDMMCLLIIYGYVYICRRLANDDSRSDGGYQVIGSLALAVPTERERRLAWYVACRKS